MSLESTHGHYYNRKGEPIDREEWGRLHADHSYVVVAVDELPGGFKISTVWLGIDHGLSYAHNLQIFETMVFPPGSLSDLECERYGREDHAKKGHEETYLRWLAGLLDGSLPPKSESE